MNGVRIYISPDSTDVFINGEVLDLFDDENIILQIKQTDIKDIAKNYNDYTYDFTVPASSRNRRLFKFWEDPFHDNQYSSVKKIPARIDIGGVTFRVGGLQIKGYKDDKQCYAVSFSANLTALTEDFAELKIGDIPTEIYAEVLPAGNYFYFYDQNIIDLLNDGDDSTIAFPLINTRALMDNYNGWNYNNSDDGGIRRNDLRPALRLKYVFKAIEKHFNTAFYGGFYDDAVFNNLFIWLNKNENPTTTLQVIGLLGSIQYHETNANNEYLSFHIDSSNNMNCYGTITRQPAPAGDHTQRRFSIGAEVGVDNDTTPYKLFIQRIVINEDGSVNEVATSAQANSGYAGSSPEYVTGNSNLIVRVPCDASFAYSETRHYRIVMEARGEITVLNANLHISYSHINPLIGSVGMSYISTKDIVFLPQFDIPSSLPEMMIKDFFLSIVKMFNVVILPITDPQLQEQYGTQKIYRLEYFNKYYANGQEMDITKFVKRNMPLSPVKTYKKFAFSHAESTYGTNIMYKKAQNPTREYGSVNAEYKDGSDGEYKVESKFNLMIWRYMNNVHEEPADVAPNQNWWIADGLDEAFEKPVLNKPVIFLYNEHAHIPSKPLNYVKTDETTASITGYPIFSNLDDIDLADYTTSLCFSQEYEGFGEMRLKSLFQNNYAPLMAGIFSPYAREYEAQAILPAIYFNQLELSTQIIIGNRKFNISEIELNITNGETKFKLNNVIEESEIIEIEAGLVPFAVNEFYTIFTSDSFSNFRQTHFHITYPLSTYSIKWKADYTLTSQTYTQARVSFLTNEFDGSAGMSWYDALEADGQTVGDHVTNLKTLFPDSGYQYASPITGIVKARIGSTITLTFYAYDIYDTVIDTQSITVTA